MTIPSSCYSISLMSLPDKIEYPLEVFIMVIAGKSERSTELITTPSWEDCEDGDEIAVYGLLKVCRVKVVTEKKLESI